MEGLGKLTYELPSTNILNQVTLEHQYTYSMMENTIHMSLLLFIFFKHIYKWVCFERKQISSKNEVKNG